jgi:hypothetical protein
VNNDRSKELAELAKQLGSENATTGSDHDERAKFLQRRFNGRLAQLDTRPKDQDLALAIVDDLVALLRMGAPTQDMHFMLAGFLEAHPVQFAETVLGVRSIGAPRIADEVKAAAVGAYALAITTGGSQEVAEIEAYDAYFQAKRLFAKSKSTKPARNFQADSTEPNKKKVRDQRHKQMMTLAESTLRDTIRPLLRKAGFHLAPIKPPGRPASRTRRKK